MRRRLSLVLGVSVILFFSSIANAEAQKIFYPRPETKLDERTGFPLTLLHLIFDRIQNGEKYALIQTPIAMPRGRALMLLQQNVVVDIFWSMTSVEREKALLAIKFPIYKGMMGWRVLLVKQDNDFVYSPDDPIAQLQQQVAIQAHDWADLKILQFNEFKVMGAASYEELFSLVSLGRADYFPRSVVEVTSEQPYLDKYKLKVDSQLLVKYPAAMYFFVNKNNLELAKDIEIGLQRATQDGSFDLLFTSIHEAPLNNLNLEQRKVINLENPYFPKSE